MTERREIKQRSQAVWDRVKTAYLAGEPAASVARRFDVGLGNLRYRAHQQGWTRRAAIDRAEAEGAAEAARLAGQADAVPESDHPAPDSHPSDSPPPFTDPAAARDAAIARGATLLAQGRAAEATALLKAAETLARLTAEAAPPPEPGPTPEEAEAAEQEASEARMANAEVVFAEVRSHFRDIALLLANAMLTDRGGSGASDEWSLAAWHWRARVLGPEVARADFARGVHGGWADRYWDAVGNLHPLNRTIPEPDPLMVRQHLSRYPGADLSQWPWNGWEEEEVEIALSERGPRARLG